MRPGRLHKKGTLVTSAAGATVGVIGLVALTTPAGAGAAPELPAKSPEQLVESVMTAQVPASAGTVEVENALGLPAIPGADKLGPASKFLGDGTREFRVWTDGQQGSRLSLPSYDRETTVVRDGSSVWTWDSGDRTATHMRADEDDAKNEADDKAEHRLTNPANTAKQLISRMREHSTVSVDGTAKVADRDAYELVLSPKPGENTVLRDVRVAVDAQTSIPLRAVVNTRGSADPALRVGFSELELAPQDPKLFQFTPPDAALVEQYQKQDREHEHKDKDGAKPKPAVIGDGWDSVYATRIPQATDQSAQSAQMLRRAGQPVSGPWGNGWVVSTKVGSVLLTSDGRLAAGAMPQQALIDAIGTMR